MPAVPEPGCLWSSPSLVLAVSKPSSIVQRCPATATSVAIPGSGRAPGREIGEGCVAEGAPDQQAACPQAGAFAAERLLRKIRQFEMRPVIEPMSLGACACGQALPHAVASNPWAICATGRETLTQTGSVSPPEHRRSMGTIRRPQPISARGAQEPRRRCRWRVSWGEGRLAVIPAARCRQGVWPTQTRGSWLARQ